jgi:hypothetical protein
MGNYESLDQKARPTSARLEVWDMLSFLALLAAAGLVGYFLIIFISPNLPINPLPPNPVNPNAPPTLTITPIQLEATWTPTPVNITVTPTLLPTITLQPSPTLFSLVPASKTPTPTSTPKAPFSFDPPSSIESVIIPHLQSAGCNWQGVAGSVLDADNSDMVGMVVRIVGTYNGKSINMTTVSGVSPDYGRSGFEFVLSTTPISTKGTLYLQLLDQAGEPQSENAYLDTFNSCQKNLVLVRFRKNR